MLPQLIAVSISWHVIYIRIMTIVGKTTAFVLLCFQMSNVVAQHTDPVDYVNVMTGTQSKYSFSTGNTYPAITLPYAMNCWVPQTGEMGNGWVYTYDAEKI